ncbi:sirohydrochlorin chelatase [Fervidicella metallireducens]|nr:CbiX/SirB N-terminal domain-containing protein [Fervidicella metallireducens]
MRGILVVGHGSRSKEAFDTFFKIVDGLRNKMDSEVEGCFMEISEPNIPETIEKMYSKGVREFTVLPYFLYSGIHIKEDIPEILAEIKEKYTDIKLSIANPLGYDEALVTLLKERAEGEVKCI